MKYIMYAISLAAVIAVLAFVVGVYYAVKVVFVGL